MSLTNHLARCLSVQYWDGDRFELISTLTGHRGEVWGVAVAHDGSFIATGSHDRSIRVWNRTDEQVFLEEEKEKRLEEMFEKEASNVRCGLRFHCRLRHPH